MLKAQTQKARMFAVSLSIDETNALLQDVPAVYHTLIDDVLLTALVRAFRRWTQTTHCSSNSKSMAAKNSLKMLTYREPSVGSRVHSRPAQTQETATTLGDDLKSMKEQLRRILEAASAMACCATCAAMKRLCDR